MAHLVHQLLTETAQRDPSRTALIAGEARRSFLELDRESDAIACALQSAGIGRGDRVAVMLENSIEYVAGLFATLKAGGVFVPVTPSTKADKLSYLLADAGARMLIAPAALARQVLPALAELVAPPAVLWVGSDLPAGATGRLYAEALGEPHRVPADPGLIDQDLAVIMYTSGTTGRPKGVMLTHANHVNTSWAISSYLGNTPDDVVMCVLPLTFGYGLSQVTTAARVGFTLVLERSFAFPQETLKRLVRHRVTGLPGVPTVFSTLLGLEAAKTADLSCLRYLTNAAAPLPAAHLEQLCRRFPQASFHSMYGMTECCTRISTLAPADLGTKPASVGRAIPNCEAFVADEDGRRLPPGQVGELVVRGANVMRGYWNRPEETARRLRRGPQGETLLFTGDLFTQDADGHLYFVSRKDDIFKCRGEKVSPKEVENALYELDEVAEACVVGVPDEADGLAVKAFLVPRDGAALSEPAIRQHCRGRLESHLVPKFIEIRDSLPKTDSGKIRRLDLMEAAAPLPVPQPLAAGEG
ncbi:class I adenylate-forming enzyme family protein [Azospirillum picis]|uniref:Amino acid adenylation domain-containing protein n=1 Tax=Azospirillum picis TaxID=488438 RepID=A0ABU0MGS0_9PROT|nr:class I adenylate-forming enzyme family protein [Azospirillum picis]MBP2299115.1 amino acid adenylation domain-containing protein [Azospirillum picis]MDQ0532643.1 amino acid adenylation domain-containing protein [Azospirillum picis]